MSNVKEISILGSTGSIGMNALDVVRRLNKQRRADSYRVVGLSAQRNINPLKEQIREFRPNAVVVADNRAAVDLKEWAKRNQPKLQIWEGVAGLERLAERKSDLLLTS